jgi:hypothetical protein
VAPAVTVFLHRALQSASEVLASTSASRTPPAASPLSPTEPALGRHVYADQGRRPSGRRGALSQPGCPGLRSHSRRVLRLL